MTRHHRRMMDGPKLATITRPALKANQQKARISNFGF